MEDLHEESRINKEICATLIEESASLNAKLKKLEDELKDSALKQQVAGKADRIQKLEVSYVEFNAISMSSLHKEIADLKARAGDGSDLVSCKNIEIDTLKTDITELKWQLADVDIEVTSRAELLSKLEVLEESAEVLMKELRLEIQQNKDFKNALEDRNQEVKDLKTKLNSIFEDNKDTQRPQAQHQRLTDPESGEITSLKMPFREENSGLKRLPHDISQLGELKEQGLSLEKIQDEQNEILIQEKYSSAVQLTEARETTNECYIELTNLRKEFEASIEKHKMELDQAQERASANLIAQKHMRRDHKNELKAKDEEIKKLKNELHIAKNAAGKDMMLRRDEMAQTEKSIGNLI